MAVGRDVLRQERDRMKQTGKKERLDQGTRSNSGRRKPPQSAKAAAKERIAELKAGGFSNVEIAKALDLHRDTVAKYLGEIAEKKAVVQQFRQLLGDGLNVDLLFGMILKAKVLKSLSEEDLSAMSVSEKRQLLRDLAVSTGITYDKIRLHEGKSTSNNSHEIQLKMVHQEMLPPLVSSGPLGHPSEYICHPPP